MTEATIALRHRCQHRQYQISCAEFDLLYDRSGGRCELCNIPEEEATKGVLFIDHDNRYGFAATRGLVCCACNQHLRWVEAGVRPLDEKVRTYFSRAWFLHLEGIRKEADPFSRETYPNSTIWRDFGRAAGMNRALLLRQFVEWFLRTPGVTLPKRPDLRELDIRRRRRQRKKQSIEGESP